MKKAITAGALLLSSAIATHVHAQNTTAEQATIQSLQERIEALEAEVDTKINLLADAVDEQHKQQKTSKVNIGGYGELHYNALSQNDTDIRELDFHRFVLFFGYEFNDRARFVSELEVEHVIASAGNRGAVELEQAYIEIDLRERMRLQTGVLLMPIGIMNETHEPPTFYGTERPIIETTIIPTTWYSAGINFSHRLKNGLRYDVMLSEGLKTEDPNSTTNAEPFNLKKGKQKGSFADAYDLAITGRVAYTGINGLELAMYAQYQPDLDQSAEISYADAATFIGGHAIYQFGNFTTRALYGRWDLDGDAAETAGQAVQDGGYLELGWRPLEHWGFFARQSAWSQIENIDATQTDIGINYWPHENIVFKADYQVQNDDAGNTDGFNLGMGYQF